MGTVATEEESRKGVNDMAEYTAVAEQTVAMNQPVVFTETVIPCRAGLINHYDGTGLFTLAGIQGDSCCCPCCQANDPEYFASFHANIAVPEGGTAGEISLALQIGGVIIPASTMTVTPTVVSAYFDIGTENSIPVFGNCCQNLAVVNVSSSNQAILVRNARIRIGLN